MEASEILRLVLDYTKESRASLAKRIDLPAHRLQDISRGKTSEIPYEVADKLVQEFPSLSRDWLLSGEGEMLVSGDASAQVNGNGNAVNNVTGNGNKVSAQVAGDFAELASKFSESLLLAQRQLSSSQSQIDRLISVLEKLTGAGGGR